MPLDPMIARGVAPIDLSNSLVEIARMREAQARTKAYDAQNALAERRYTDQLAQQDEDDAEWERAYATKDWGAMARIDPQTTKILWDHEQASKPQVPKRDVREVGGALVEVPTEGDPRVLYQAPRQAPQYAPTDAERNWRLRESLPPDKQAEFDRLYGKGDGKAAEAAAADQQRTARRADDAKNVLAAIDEAKELVSGWSAGFVGQKFRAQGGTPAFDLNAKINTVKANIGFDRLQRMREESKTGGALGQVAVQELEMLQSVITSLDTAQSPEQLLKALDAVAVQYEKAMKAYEAAQQEGQGAANPTNGPVPGVTKEGGYIYIGGDPGKRESWVKER